MGFENIEVKIFDSDSILPSNIRLVSNSSEWIFDFVISVHSQNNVLQ
jgi:hypothetical protein